MRKILLNKNRGKQCINNIESIPVEINRDTSLLHDNLLTNTVDILSVYNQEKDKTTKHRFIFTIQPIQTNVLYNNITEIIYKEGSDDTVCLDNTRSTTKPPLHLSVGGYTGLNRLNAIRNTEFSNSVFDLTYHCGADIFNNHLLRAKEDVSVQPLNDKSLKTYRLYSDANKFTNEYSFNTIADYSRSFSGDNIIGKKPTSSWYLYDKKTKDIAMPLYLTDTVYPFIEAYNDGISRKDGWVGFYNKTTFHIPVGKLYKCDACGTLNNQSKSCTTCKKSSLTEIDDYFVNRCINNVEPCQFIDMAPERDLFYFAPKKNAYRKRNEYNWKYCLTYPAESIYNDGKLLIGRKYGLPLESIYENEFFTFKTYLSSSGRELALFRCSVKHNLQTGDRIKLLFQDGSNVLCTIISLGDSTNKNKDYYFSLNLQDFNDLVENNNQPYRFIKTSNGLECEYYFRKFKKFNENLSSTINRLAFADTIYGDEIAQIVFTDDVDILNYRDNRGYPLTEIYLTIIKNNSGYKKWYEENIYNDSGIEYSHVFGSVSSGMDMPKYVSVNKPSIRKQHNIDIAQCPSNIEIPVSSEKLENDLTINQNEFYGDLVEFNPATCQETILEVVKHRFNTAQRETLNSKYTTLYHDEIFNDFYDAARYHDTGSDAQYSQIMTRKLNEGFANLNPEGYLYIPHHKVKIGEFTEEINQGTDRVINVVTLSFTDNFHTQIEFVTTDNYGFIPHDLITLMDKETYEICRFRITEYAKTYNTYIGKAELLNGQTLTEADFTKYYVFQHNNAIPDYAYMVPDGSGRHIWRDIIPPSEYTFDSDLYETPFTNGAFYHHSNVIFPVRRQDPFTAFGLSVRQNGQILENNFEIPANEFDYSGEEYYRERDKLTCY